MNHAHSRPTDDQPRSRWSFLLFFVWASLCAWITFELVRGVSFSDDGVALPAFMLLVTTAVLGSRIYVFIQERARRKPASLGPPD